MTSSAYVWGRAVLALGLVVAIVLALVPGAVWAHAFVKRSLPRSNTTISEPPEKVQIWFDGPVEPVFITVRVENSQKQRVDKGDARLSSTDNTLVEVGLPLLSPGRYRVLWNVVA